jgi:hypothetical protein
LKGKSYEERLKIMKLPSLSYRRLRGDLIEAYKYTHGLYKVPEGLPDFETRTNTRGEMIIVMIMMMMMMMMKAIN